MQVGAYPSVTIPDTAGYISDMQRVVDLVSDWAVHIITSVVDVLMPDGKPFDYEEDPQQKMRDYLQLRGNPEAWLMYIQTQADQITQKLQSAGISEEDILSVHPYDLAQRFAIEFSVHMESQLRGGSDAGSERSATTPKDTTVPTR